MLTLLIHNKGRIVASYYGFQLNQWAGHHAHVGMHAYDTSGKERGHVMDDEGAPVAPLDVVPVVLQAFHEVLEDDGHLDCTQARANCWFRETVTCGQGIVSYWVFRIYQL